ncbi:hypothetical protein MJM43_30845, partial [Salmonella enterica subsp. enterica serovar Montevideo]|nr:hypothetical protein [Salmonella enterica subsp. enterica serovar Montevideo]
WAPREFELFRLMDNPLAEGLLWHYLQRAPVAESFIWRRWLYVPQGHPDADLLLWRGVEMVEILSTLSMDIDTLRAALLFPLADA